MLRLKNIFPLLAGGIFTVMAALSSCAGGSPAAEKHLATQIAAVKTTCPAAVDSLTILADITDDGAWLTYHMIVSSEADVDDMDQTMAQMHDYIGSGLGANPATLEFVSLLTETGRGLRYEFRFAGYDIERSVEFTTDELLRISQPTQP